jgi:hypothetical protein
MKFLGEISWHLSRIRWDLFASMTFRGSVPRRNVRLALAWRWLRNVADLSQVPLERLLVVIREEQGEVGGRHHLHALIGGCRAPNVVSLAFQSRYAWSRLCGGFCVVRPYDRRLSAAEYICKCLGEQTDAGRTYERDKFDRADTVTLSRSLRAVLMREYRICLDAADRTPEKLRGGEPRQI